MVRNERLRNVVVRPQMADGLLYSASVWRVTLDGLTCRGNGSNKGRFESVNEELATWDREELIDKLYV